MLFVFITDLQWKAPQDLAAENYMMSMGPSAYNTYWTGMQPGMDGFMGPYGGAMPYMGGYGLSPFDMPFGGVMPPVALVAGSRECLEDSERS